MSQHTLKGKILKIVIGIVRYVIIYFSVLSVRHKHVFVFGSWLGNRFSDNSKYLYLQALKDKSLTPVWITKDAKVYESLKESGYKVYLANSIKGIYYQLKAYAYFTCVSKKDINSLLIGNAIHINLWHGVGLKKIMNDDKINFTINKSRYQLIKSKVKFYLDYLPYHKKEYIVSTSDAMSKIFMSAFNKNKNEVLQFGQPRNDVFYNDELETQPFYFKLSAQKIILYMPTHRSEGKEKMMMSKLLNLPVLNAFCADNHFLFLIKKHFYHSSEVEELQCYSHIQDVTQEDYDTQLLLKYADVLITDYSSCYIDFLLLDRPIIFYNFDYKNYVINDRDLYFNYDDTTPGLKVENFESLFKALNNALLKGIDEFAVKRQLVKNLFYDLSNQKEVGLKILDFVKTKL